MYPPPTVVINSPPLIDNNDDTKPLLFPTIIPMYDPNNPFCNDLDEPTEIIPKQIIPETK